MRIGLIARADNRGLAIQTHAFYRHLQPDRTLVIDSSAISPFYQDLSLYPDALIAPWDTHQIDDDLMVRFLRGLHVVYTAETPYDYRIYDMARALGIRTVCHINPEFYRHHNEPDLPRPDVIWLPSSWEAHRIRGGRILPFPVDRTHFPFRLRTAASAFLHVVGRRAMRDRNGTMTVYKATRRLKRETIVIVRAQDRLPRYAMARHVTLKIIEEDLKDNRDLYTEGDVLVLPRRYGGLCLPMNEALSLGMPVLMTDCPPQSGVLPPEMLVRSRPSVAVRTQAGMLPTHDMLPDYLARQMDALTANPAEVERLSKEADRIAQAMSWDVMLPVYRAALEEACA